jgi:hypothetical protein
MPCHFIVILLNEKSVPVFRIILHRVSKNIPCYEFVFYTSYHLHFAHEMQLKVQTLFSKTTSQSIF